jgi:uncharacterized membrane protein YgcG
MLQLLPVFKNLIFLFLFAFLIFPSYFPVLAQNSFRKSIPKNSVNSAQKNSNFTDNIEIKITESSDNLELEYNILQTFSKASRGIFLSFPKNMDGIWTDFQVQSVQKTNLTSYLQNKNFSKNEIQNEPQIEIQNELEKEIETEMQNELENEPKNELNFAEIKKDNLANLSSEKYEHIKEWNEFRVRIGEVDKILEKGIYLYQIKIKTTKNSQNQYNFRLLGDWNDQIGSFEIIKNNQIYCNSAQQTISFKNEDEKCNLGRNLQIRINPEKSEVSNLIKFWLSSWLYLVILLIVSSFGYLGWFFLARDPDYGFATDKPEFEPPNLLPWESQFLVNDGKLDFKNTFLSYLLYLSNHKFIKILGQNEQNSNSKNNNSNSFFGKIVNKMSNKKEEKVQIQILKPLPNLLPNKFNEAIRLMETDGFEQGIYNSQINSSLQGEIETNIYTKLKHFYLQGYNNWQISVLITILVIGNILWFFALFGFIQKTFLIGNSYQFIIPFASLVAVLWLIFILIKFSKLTRIGAETKVFCQRYNYYITKVEQFKLDFSNNPKEGVQYYLKILPYAAIIGFLPQFQKYLVNLFPQIQEVSEISNSLLIANALNSTTFYTPPSSDSSGSGSDTSWSSGGFDGDGGSW